jgi:hypothetical protein
MTGGTHPSATAAGGARSWAALGRKRSGSLGARCDGKPGGGAEGLPPDLDRWAAQKEQGKEGKDFSNFETKDSNKIQTQV